MKPRDFRIDDTGHIVYRTTWGTVVRSTVPAPDGTTEIRVTEELSPMQVTLYARTDDGEVQVGAAVRA